MRPALGRHWPLLVSCAILLCVVLFLYGLCREINGGFAYTLDDPYIHIAMARSFAFHGVWGITPREFTSASSSPLWTLLLAVAFRLTGSHSLWPLALNLLAAFGVLGAAYAGLRRAGASDGWVLAGLFCLWLLGCIPYLIFAGMEHTLQILLSLLFVERAARTLCGEPPRRRWELPALACLLPMARYEGLFLIAAFCGLALARGRWRMCAAVAGAAAVSVLVYGAWCVAHGWHWLPNSVLLKSHVGPGHTLQLVKRWARIAERIQTTAHVRLMLYTSAAIVAARIGRRRFWSPDCVLHVLFLIVAPVHLALVTAFLELPTDRYQAYVVALFVYATAVTVASTRREEGECGSVGVWECGSDRNPDPHTPTPPHPHTTSPALPLRPPSVLFGGLCVFLLPLDLTVYRISDLEARGVRYLAILSVPILLAMLLDRQKLPRFSASTRATALRLGALALLFVALCPLFERGALGLRLITKGSTDIYRQQVQMARFLRTYYPGQAVAVNDIGAVAFLGRARPVDLEGLACEETAERWFRNDLTAGAIRDIVMRKGARIAIIYDSWFVGLVPPEWRKVADWDTSQNNLVCGDDLVTFYATDPVEAPRLAASLRAFRPQLPPYVEYFPYKDGRRVAE